MVISRSIRVAANGIILLFFKSEYYPTVYRFHIFFVHSSVDGPLDCFCVVAVVNSAAVNVAGQVSFYFILFIYFYLNHGFLLLYLPKSGIIVERFL